MFDAKANNWQCQQLCGLLGEYKRAGGRHYNAEVVFNICGDKTWYEVRICDELLITGSFESVASLLRFMINDLSASAATKEKGN